MKTKFILSSLILAVSLFAQPKLFIENTTFDWGIVPEGNERIRNVFTVANRGKDTLRITNIRSSCGCTVAEYDSIIAPGKTGGITSEFNKAGRTGQQSSTLTVFTNDTENPQIRLTMRGHIKTPLSISTTWQTLVSDNGKVRGNVSFISENKNLQITRGRYTMSNDPSGVISSNVALTLKNKSRPDKNGNITYEYEFNFKRQIERNEIGSITFETNMKEKPTISMNVSIEPGKEALY
jgi:hypothetical protein